MFTRPRGTRDLLPREMEARRAVERILRKVFERYGYREIQSPSFEHLELITAKSGEEINEHLYSFEDKSQRKLALRPELSAPTIRLYVNELRTMPKPRKLYYFENCFRYERPQKGRYREFWQAGVELIGSSRPEAEAEVITLSVRCLEQLGLRDYTLSIGHLGIIRSLLGGHGLEEDVQNRILGLLDKKDVKGLERSRIPAEVREDLLTMVGLKGSWKEIEKPAAGLLRKTTAQEVEAFKSLMSNLKTYGVNDYRVDLGIARGLDYYTGMVFEIHAKGLGSQNQICGGGTYSLVKLLGGAKEPSCGFAFGFDRLLIALESQGVLPRTDSTPKLFVVPETWKVLNRAINITSALRKEVSCDLELMGRKLEKSLSYANSEGIPYVLIVPENEKGEGVILKDMRTGRQKMVKVKEVPDAIK